MAAVTLLSFYPGERVPFPVAMGGFQSRSGLLEKRQISFPCWGSIPGPYSPYVVLVYIYYYSSSTAKVSQCVSVPLAE